MKRFQGFVVGFLVACLLVPLSVLATDGLLSINVAMNQMRFSVNGKPVVVPNFVYQGVTYVPIRAAAEALGKTVGWDGGDGVSIDDPVVADVKPTPVPTVAPVVVAPTPIPTETAADRMRELLAWVTDTVGVKASTKHVPSSAVASRERMEIWKREFLTAMGGETMQTTTVDSYNFGLKVVRACETATKMLSMQLCSYCYTGSIAGSSGVAKR